MPKRTLEKFTEIEPEGISKWIVPFGALLLLFGAWARYWLRYSVGFHVDESVILTGLSIALLQLSLGLWLIPFGIGLFLWIYGILGFGDFALVVEMGSTQGAGPWVRGGLSPNGSIVTATLGLSLSVLSRRHRRQFQTLLGLLLAQISLAVSLVAAWGHLNGIKPAFAWSRFEEFSWSASFLFSLASVLMIVICRVISERDAQPTARQTTMSVGLLFSVAGTLAVAAMLGDVESRRTTLLASEMTSARRTLETQQDALIKALKLLTLSVRDLGPSSLESNGVQLLKQFRYLRAVAVTGEKGKLVGVYPSGVEVDELVASSLVREVKSDQRIVDSKIVQRGEVWRLLVALGTEGGSYTTLALVDLRDLFNELLSSLPEETVVKVSYIGEVIIGRGKQLKDESGEVHDLAFNLFGWPGWRFTLSPGPGFDEVHALSGVFRIPLMVLLTAGALGWAWSLSVRARTGTRILEKLTTSALFAENERTNLLDLIEQIPSPVIQCDCNEKITFLNNSAKLFCLNPSGSEQFLSDVFDEKTVLQIRREGIPKATLGEQCCGTATFNSSAPDSKGTTFLISLSCNRTIDGDLAGYTIAAIDGVNQDKESSQISVQRGIDSVATSVWLANSAGEINFGNRRLLNTLGVTQERFCEGWPIGFCDRDDIAGFEAIGAKLGTNQRRILCHGGELAWFEETVSAIRGQNGDALGFVGTLLECGKEKTLTDQIRFVHELLGIVMKAEKTVFWLEDLARQQVTLVSECFEEIFGIRSSELKLNPDTWEKLAEPKAIVPAKIPQDGISLTYNLHEEDGREGRKILHRIWRREWGLKPNIERYNVHIVESISESLTNYEGVVARESMRELNTMYEFLADTISNPLSAILKNSADGVISREEYSTLVTFCDLFQRTDKIRELSETGSHAVTTPIIALQNAKSGVMPTNISFSGNLGSSLPLTKECATELFESIARYASLSSKSSISKDIRVEVSDDGVETKLEFDLGDLSVDPKELWRAFLPFDSIQRKVRDVELPIVSAIARLNRGRVWLYLTEQGALRLSLVFKNNMPKQRR